MRVAIMRSGLFHPKVWILSDDQDSVVVHGSSNFTAPGLLYNYETVSVERPWRGSDAAEKVIRFVTMFTRLWERKDPNAVVLDIPDALKKRLIARGQNAPPPTMEDYVRAWEEDVAAGRETGPLQGVSPARESSRAKLTIPGGLTYDSGRFAHQGAAVAAWEGAHRRGILAMATGSGKTISAMVAATRLQTNSPRLFIMVAVPYRPLLKQWANEVERFGVTPLPLLVQGAMKRRSELDAAARALRLDVSSVVVVVVTHDFLVSGECDNFLNSLPPNVDSLLIADEVHNLGRPRFIANPPHQFRFRLGLSATPERQYDPVGTAALFEFFGPKVFEFGLEQAIGTCLVPYDYEARQVTLAADEVDEWVRLTEELRKAGFGTGDADAEECGKLSPRVVKLLVQRRAVIEAAEGKIAELASALDEQDPRSIRHLLIYATDKNPRQLLAVNELLRNRGILFHQVTQEETGDRHAMERLLEQFAEGEIQVLTAKRVLDEGVDIPEIQAAYLLASSTVRRQWVQRRGRVLRRCDRIGKQKARIVDFIVRAPFGADRSTKALQRQEVARLQEFAALSDNAGDPGGVLELIGELSA